MVNRFFNWFFDVKPSLVSSNFIDGDIQKGIERDIELEKQKILEQVNFKMEDETSCLFEKVLDSVRYNFEKWEFTRYGYVNDSDNSSISLYGRGEYTDGTLTIEGANFDLNNDACKRFENLWKEMEVMAQQLKREEVLKKWGCK